MRFIRALIISIALLALGCPSWSHGAEELGHHWEMPVYRGEMLKQIAIMGFISTIAFLALLIKNTYRRRRVKQ